MFMKSVLAKLLKATAFFIGVCILFSTNVSCSRDDDMQSYETPTKNSIVGTYTHTDDGDVYRLTFYSGGTGKYTCNGKVKDENGYSSMLGKFEYEMLSKTKFVIVFDDSGIEVTGSYNGGSTLYLDGIIFKKEQ